MLETFGATREVNGVSSADRVGARGRNLFQGAGPKEPVLDQCGMGKTLSITKEKEMWVPEAPLRGRSDAFLLKARSPTN